MKPLLNGYFKISGFCVVIALFLQNWALKFLYDHNLWQSKPAFLIGVTGGLGAYYTLYKALVALYEFIGWKIVFRRYAIDGTWYHIIESKEEPDYIRYGRTDIQQGTFSLSIVGINYDVLENGTLNRSTRSLWRSTAATIGDNGWLVFSYDVIRACGEENKKKSGLAEVHIYGSPFAYPDRLEGVFQDTYPSKRHGTITWQRTAKWANLIPTLDEAGKNNNVKNGEYLMGKPPF